MDSNIKENNCIFRGIIVSGSYCVATCPCIKICKASSKRVPMPQHLVVIRPVEKA